MEIVGSAGRQCLHGLAADVVESGDSRCKVRLETNEIIRVSKRMLRPVPNYLAVGMPRRCFAIVKDTLYETLEGFRTECPEAYMVYTGYSRGAEDEMLHGIIVINLTALRYASRGYSGMLRVYVTEDESPCIDTSICKPFLCTVPWCTEIPMKWLQSPKDNFDHVRIQQRRQKMQWR